MGERNGSRASRLKPDDPDPWPESVHDDVEHEATHDWLDERDDLRADERPDPAEYARDRDLA